ncbi:unnamed protein product [Candida parapsilosis]
MDKSGKKGSSAFVACHCTPQHDTTQESSGIFDFAIPPFCHHKHKCLIIDFNGQVQLHGIINNSNVSIVLEDELLEFVNDRQLIIELVDLLVDELNLQSVYILIKRSDDLSKMKRVLQFMNAIFVCSLISDSSQMAIDMEKFDPYEWIGLICEL